MTLAHEVEHALADQTLHLVETVGGPAAADRNTAYVALVEGDATLTMELYALKYVGLDDQLSLGENVPGEEEFAALPDYVQRSLLFPYLEGLRFVCHRLADGGMREIDHAYADPPAATSQVIFPDRYGVIEPVKAELPPKPAPGWTAVSHRELGAAELEWLFHAPGGDPLASLPEPRTLVFGWAGGELELWRQGDERALAISLRRATRYRLVVRGRRRLVSRRLAGGDRDAGLWAGGAGVRRARSQRRARMPGPRGPAGHRAGPRDGGRAGAMSAN